MSLTGFEEWESQISSTFVPLRATLPARDVTAFHGGVDSAALGSVTLSQVSASGAIVERTPRLIRQEDPQLYKFGLQVSGTCVLEQDGRQASLQPGDFAVYDTSRPYRLAFGDDFTMTVAMFPRPLVRLPERHLAQLTAVRLAGDSGLASLIAPLMRGLSADLAGGATVIATHLGDAVVDLVTAAFAQQLGAPVSAQSPAGHRALVAGAHRFIDDNLHDPTLSPREIAASQHVSVRSLQKAFESEGRSITQVLRTRRLDRCRRDLADPLLQGVSISSIAARWGLGDASQFSHQFKAAYGASPRDYRQGELRARP